VEESLLLELRPDSPARARRWIRGICSARGLAGLADGARLLISELMTNALLHAGSRCRVTVDIGAHTMRLQVTDEGRRELRAVAPHSCTDSEYDFVVSGRGLTLMAALPDRWGVAHHSTGKSVWCTLADPSRMSISTCEEPGPTR